MLHILNLTKTVQCHTANDSSMRTTEPDELGPAFTDLLRPAEGREDDIV